MNSKANPFPGISLIFSSSFHFPFQLFLQLCLSKLLSKPQRAIFSGWSYNTVDSAAQLWLAFHTVYLVTLREVPMTCDFPSTNPLPDLPYRVQSKKIRQFSIAERLSRHKIGTGQGVKNAACLTPILEHIFNVQELLKSLVLECDFSTSNTSQPLLRTHCSLDM